MSEAITSRIQSIQDRIKEIENFGKVRPTEKKAEAASKTNTEGFSQMMKEIGTNQNLGGLLDGESSPQNLMQNRIDSFNSLTSEVLSEAVKAQEETSSAKRVSRSNNFKDIILRAAKEHNVDPKLIHAIISAESNYNPDAVSSKGARGLMQLMPATAKDLGVANSFDPEQNIFGGTLYVKELLQRYQGDLIRTLAAYNAGPSAVDKAKGIPRIAETQIYVPKVLNKYYNLNQEN